MPDAKVLAAGCLAFGLAVGGVLLIQGGVARSTEDFADRHMRRRV